MLYIFDMVSGRKLEHGRYHTRKHNRVFSYYAAKVSIMVYTEVCITKHTNAHTV